MNGLRLSLLVMVAALMGLLAPGGAGASTYTSPAAISILDAANASPYPSTIAVAGVDGTVTQVRATLNSFVHTYPNDTEVLLVSPSGAATILMAQVCGDESDTDEDALGQTFTFDDAAPTLIPDNLFCPSGTYRPTIATSSVSFDPPAPPGAHSLAAMAALNGIPANGPWNLFVQDVSSTDSGVISGGWSLDLLTDAKCSGEQATLTGTAGDDELRGTPGKDVILGFGGKDEVKGLAGKDILCGGPGKDELNGGKSKDELLGQGGKDKLKGGGGNDTCKGGGASDAATSCETEKSL